MINYGKQSIDESDLDVVNQVLKEDFLTQGPHVENFENQLKSYFGSEYACAVSNGTAALHLSGLSLGWGRGDIILTSPITFLATVNSIVYSNATPDLVRACDGVATAHKSFAGVKLLETAGQFLDNVERK